MSNLILKNLYGWFTDEQSCSDAMANIALAVGTNFTKAGKNKNFDLFFLPSPDPGPSTLSLVTITVRTYTYFI